jgi:hypothetical protein
VGAARPASVRPTRSLPSPLWHPASPHQADQSSLYRKINQPAMGGMKKENRKKEEKIIKY